MSLADHDGFDVAVAGGGPAGCVAALGVARLGHRVALISRPRRHRAFEGLSARTVEGLRAAGLGHALDTVGPEVRRRAAWAGLRTDANAEFITDRERFDGALLDDARAGGVAVVEGRVRRVDRREEGWRVLVEGGEGAREIGGRFLVEARGREAPAAGGRRLKGPATTALGRLWRLPPKTPPGTAVASFAEGWAWYAAPGDGRALVQLFLVSGRGRLPAREALTAFYDARLAEVAEADGWLTGATPEGPVEAREASPVLTRPVARRDRLRVGDAALAIDPLSGQGIFEALGSGLAAAPVVNTLLERPGDSGLAIAFYRERALHSFRRHARVGRDFYRQEEARRGGAFWAERVAWPDDEPAHEPSFSAPPGIVDAPVIEDGFVVRREVVVTADQPRGVWVVAGVSVVALLRLVQAGAPAEPVALAARLNRPPGDIDTALAWLKSRQLIA